MTAVRTAKSKGCSYLFAGDKGLTADLALKLAVTTIVVIKIIVRCSATRANGIRWNGTLFTRARRNGVQMLLVFPEIVFEQELIVLFLKTNDGRKLVHFEFLVFRGTRIVKEPLLHRDVFANEIE